MRSGKKLSKGIDLLDTTPKNAKKREVEKPNTIADSLKRLLSQNLMDKNTE